MHTIRLRGPWHFEVVRAAADSPPPLAASGRVTMPADWEASLGADFRGTVRYRRVFHRPTNLAPDDRVVLMFSEVRGALSAWLSGQPLASLASDERWFDITSLLSDSCELIAEITHDAGPGPGGLVGEVRLEITPAT